MTVLSLASPRGTSGASTWIAGIWIVTGADRVVAGSGVMVVGMVIRGGGLLVPAHPATARATRSGPNSGCALCVIPVTPTDGLMIVVVHGCRVRYRF